MPPKSTTVTRLIERKEQVWAENILQAPILDELSRYIHPTRLGFMSPNQPGQKQTDFVFDSTALECRDRLGSSLSGSLMSRALDWFGLRYRIEDLNEDTEAKLWLEEADNIMLRSFGHSSLYSEGDEVFQDLAGLGMGALFIDEKEPKKGQYGGCIYRSLHLSEFGMDEDPDGRVDTMFRTFCMSLQAVLMRWGYDELGRKAQKLVRDGKLSTQMDFLHAVFPRDPEKQAKNSIKMATQLPWASFWVEMGDEKIVSEGGYHEFPFMVPRWRKSSGEKWGRGPGHIALPHVRTLNKAVELGLSAWEKAIDPPMNALVQGTIGELNLTPGAINRVTNMANFAPTYPPGTLREAVGTSQINVADTRAAIRRVFYADQLELPVGSYMTATEVVKRFELLERLLGPTLGRIEIEFLNPLIDRVFSVMLRRGAFGQPPRSVLQHGADIDIEYQGPLAKSQRLSEVEGIERLIQVGAAMQPFAPDVFDNLNEDEAFRVVASVVGAPAKVLTDPQEMEEDRAARAEQESQAVQAQGLREDAVAASKAAPLLSAVQGGMGTAQ